MYLNSINILLKLSVFIIYYIILDNIKNYQNIFKTSFLKIIIIILITNYKEYVWFLFYLKKLVF